MITKAQAKYIQSLSDKKFRTEMRCFVAEGPKIINEFLEEKSVEPIAVYATEEWGGSPANADLTPVLITKRELENISFLSTPNQVLGVFKLPVPDPSYDFWGKLTLVLDGIQDPGNLGTIIRIADWFGIKAIVASKDSADAYNPKVVQSTMGSLARVQIFSEDLVAFLHNHRPIPILAAALDGISLAKIGRVKEGFLVIGNESKGISTEILELATQKLTIPKIGKAESLNAGVAAGILVSAITIPKG
jgi:TrmH family RNA methyltransferase